MKLIIFTDGASRGNPGPSSYGFIVSDGDGKLLIEKGEFIGIATNNVAEYTGVLEALQVVFDKFRGESIQIELFADSKLVAEQLSGRYKIKSPHLKPIIKKIKEISLSFASISYSHVPRAKNSEADRLANKALDSL